MIQIHIWQGYTLARFGFEPHYAPNGTGPNTSNRKRCTLLLAPGLGTKKACRAEPDHDKRNASWGAWRSRTELCVSSANSATSDRCSTRGSMTTTTTDRINQASKAFRAPRAIIQIGKGMAAAVKVGTAWRINSFYWSILHTVRLLPQSETGLEAPSQSSDCPGIVMI